MDRPAQLTQTVQQLNYFPPDENKSAYYLKPRDPRRRRLNYGAGIKTDTVQPRTDEALRFGLLDQPRRATTAAPGRSRPVTSPAPLRNALRTIDTQSHEHIANAATPTERACSSGQLYRLSKTIRTHLTAITPPTGALLFPKSY